MSFTCEREFKLWDYKVSHKQLLLRSPRTPTIATNIDIVFWDVSYIAISTILNGLTLAKASLDDVGAVEKATGLNATKLSVKPYGNGLKRCWHAPLSLAGTEIRSGESPKQQCSHSNA
jgi:hypothetical protein